MTKTEQTATAEFRFINPDKISAWALLLANRGFTVQARHVKTTLKDGDPDGVMKVSGPATGLITVKKALALAGAELITTSPKAVPTTNMQAMGIFWDHADIPDAKTLFAVWGFQIVLHPEIIDECSARTAHASIRGPSALDEDEFVDWLTALGKPVGLDLDCFGKDDSPTDWEWSIELPKRLQREFPDYHQRFLEGEFPSVYAAAEACGLLPSSPHVAN